MNIENNFSVGSFAIDGDSFSIDVKEDFSKASKLMPNDKIRKSAYSFEIIYKGSEFLIDEFPKSKDYYEETEEKISDYIDNSIKKWTSDFTLNIEKNYKKSTEALLETRTTNGVVDQILFTNNQMGDGYNNLPDLRISTGLTLTFVSLAGEVFPDTTSGDVYSAMKGMVTRVLNSVKFNSIKDGSSTTAGGFKIGDSYVINETGGVLGVYATDYFLEDYTLTGVSNNAYVRVTSLDAVGYPATFEVLAVGQGFNRQDFQIELESPTGEIALVDFTTGYNAVLGGVAGDAGGFLSDANKLFDNLVYQPFAYQIQSELQASEWKEYATKCIVEIMDNKV